MVRCSLAERNIRLFCKFSKVDLFDLKNNCPHSCQESVEMNRCGFGYLYLGRFFAMGGKQLEFHKFSTPKPKTSIQAVMPGGV